MNKPYKKVRKGKWQLSFWEIEKIIPASNDFVPERVYRIYRCCLQHSEYDRINRDWRRQSIWFSLTDLSSLIDIIRSIIKEEDDSSLPDKAEKEAKTTEVLA